MNTKKVKTVIGIISYNDIHYLEKALPIITSLPDSHIVILDNATNDEVKAYLAKNYPEIDFIRHEDGNVGFSKGHNYIVEKSPQSDYYFCLNNDILLDTDGVKACVNHLDKHEDVCMVSSKLYHWDFENDKKTKVIDTFGIIGNRGHHFWDRGQGKKDKGQYDNTIENVFGISGAAFFIRRSCIKKLHGSDHQIFDENIFMYKDDVDLAYRMKWQDMRIAFLLNTLGYHARTVSKGKKKSLLEAKQSYRNHLIMIRNNYSWKYSWNTMFTTFVREFAKFLYYLIKNREVMKEYFAVKKMTNLNKPKHKIAPKKMESYLLK